MENLWIKDWNRVKQNYIDWWSHKGLVLHIDGIKTKVPHDDVPHPGTPASFEQRYTDPVWCAQENRYRLSNTAFLADTLPMAMPDWGTVTLSTFLGSEPGFSDATVWYNPCLTDDNMNEPLFFSTDQKWWKVQEKVLKETVKRGQGNYLVGCPALTPGVDTLAALRGTEELLIDMLERPEWVKGKLTEINKAYFAAVERMYEIIALDDGSTPFGYFSLWGPRRISQVQCDTAAMISPKMFEEFVIPSLTEQCMWLDHSMFHLDGTQCLCHLDSLLSMDYLDAIEWTPQAGIENGGDSKWYDLYRRILNAGKSVQVIGVEPGEVIPLLDAIGSKGVYIMTHTDSEDTANKLIEQVERYR